MPRDKGYAGGPTVPFPARITCGQRLSRAVQPGGRRPGQAAGIDLRDPRLLGQRVPVGARVAAHAPHRPTASPPGTPRPPPDRRVSQSRNSNAQRQPGESLTLTWRLTLWPGSALACSRLTPARRDRHPAGCGVSCSNPGRPREPGRGQRAAPTSSAVCQVRHGQLQVDDVLGRHPRDRGRPDVIDPGAAGCQRHPGRQPARVGRPPRLRIDQLRATVAEPAGQPGVLLERQQPVAPQRINAWPPARPARRRCPAARRTAAPARSSVNWAAIRARASASRQSAADQPLHPQLGIGPAPR